MKEKIIDYIEQLEVKAYQSDTYFKERNELYISNQEKDKEIERLNIIIDNIFNFMQNKYDNSDLTGFTISFMELQDLRKLKGGNKDE